MNMDITSRYLQFLRKSHNYTQEDLTELLKMFGIGILVTTLMGASPETNSLCERLFPNVDFEMIRNNVGRVRIETIEDWICLQSSIS